MQTIESTETTAITTHEQAQAAGLIYIDCCEQRTWEQAPMWCATDGRAMVATGPIDAQQYTSMLDLELGDQARAVGSLWMHASAEARALALAILAGSAAEIADPIAARVRDLDVIAPAPGWEDRAAERADEVGLFERRPGAPRPVTGPAGDNPITDEQIRELQRAVVSSSGNSRYVDEVNRDVEFALADYLSASARAHYRDRCAAAWNARHGVDP